MHGPKLSVLLVAALGTSAFAQPANEPERANSFSGTLTALNGSGVSGSFTIEQKGQGQIRVHIQAIGLEATSGPNVSHIHGLEGNTDSTCPTLAQDVDMDEFVELAEGQQTYGPIIVDFGDVDPNDDGTVDFSTTINLNTSSSFMDGMDKGDLLPLENRHIVIHGMTLEEGEGGTNEDSIPPNEADGTAGYKIVLPVACGEIQKNPRENALQFRTPN